jgi:ABC-type polysaccharide/polyol phosphate export permease
MLSVANVFFRDVEHLLAVAFLPWFFLTPVLYGLDQFSVASSHRWLILLLRYGNPVTPYVESVRAVVLQHTVPGLPLLVYVFVVGPVVALLGLWVMQRYEDRIAIEL